MTDSDLPDRLAALAETLVGDEWEHPIDSVEICRRAAEEIISLREALRSERRQVEIKLAEINVLIDSLRWANHNGGMAYVLGGVGQGEIWALLANARQAHDKRAVPNREDA